MGAGGVAPTTSTELVDAWVEHHGTVVPSAAYGRAVHDMVLYDVANATSGK
jgi:hypothetical protein